MAGFQLQSKSDLSAIVGLLSDALAKGAEGDVVEIGCNAGKTSVELARCLKAMGSLKRLVLFDSFQGLPEQSEGDAGTSQVFKPGLLAVDKGEVTERFSRAGLPEPAIVPGWIEKTIPENLPEQIAFALIDVDYHDPILYALEHVYPRLSDGGVCVIHDARYQELPGAGRAVREFTGVHADVTIRSCGEVSQYFIKRPTVSGLRPLNVLFASFPYGGNGGISSEVPNVRDWLLRAVPKAMADERIGRVSVQNISDTPITMTRNRAVKVALDNDFDILVMVDSDMAPDLYLGRDPSAKPFFETAFDFIHSRYPSGPTCVAAPYCGPPPDEICYVFHWQNRQSEHPNPDFELEKYTRAHAAMMSGVQECAALPTGLIMFDTRCFRLTRPKHPDFVSRMTRALAGYAGRAVDEKDIEDIARVAEREKLRNEQSWFYYEYGRPEQDEKCSTEDVTATRDISWHGMIDLGYNPVHCAWDCWAGHWKPKCVGKPMLFDNESVAEKFVRAIRDKESRETRDERWVDVGSVKGVA